MYENDHFNQTQAEFKKEVKGQSKHAAQKKGGRKRERDRELYGAQIALLFLALPFFYNWLYLCQ